MKDEQLLRYSRHILLPEIDVSGQQTLLTSHVAIVGLGGLGSPAAMYLAAAGVGKLTLIDFDAVELSNLQRQIIHTNNSIGRAKVESAAERIAALNTDVNVQVIAKKLSPAELESCFESVDLVLDCTDRFSSRFAINYACVASSTPWLSAAAIGMDGQLIGFEPARNGAPCYACLYDDDGDEGRSCSEEGVLSPLLGVIGSLQATMALRWLIDGPVNVGEMQRFDARLFTWQNLRLPAKPDCPVCAQRG
ncbi:HesA/MoeB/ThiF family protein [Pseudoteredinibacter isoporae]|uniref:Adenylyltransferase/sulfurtransferase n=1 Tax=Pseudoteredinibacter isoporae TaxID=570281 RepID=A0A7X0JR80_9GAMM|nr:HesA/MoeB/ThiF family protein [Pseudoteredinibacter isoporae]MBB6520805.1 adenylyltransferase/sulfurtransferase [Pseudoteredinibacter isoporae]NHO86371.1 HesA/MoeB/ThiF family protein [Pseudoteredinibacter isoporae]NIB25177.1 HesA/MoeB/ThiF family protein [Pseudoteredinibacter isoporae]